MKKLLWITLVLIGCSAPTEKEKEAAKDVELVTSMGTIVLRLYDETPQHRDNFIKLVEDQFYDSILFHRVIENFMVQAGDPGGRSASAGDTLGRDDLPYTVPAEFHPEIFHKRGALGAARDGNPARASSSTQFYIVQGRVYTDSLLDAQLNRVNNWLAMNRVVNDSSNQAIIERRNQLRESDPESDSLQIISDLLNNLAEADLENTDRYEYPAAHREAYQTIGGAAHLDQNYTVFGEVVKGLEVIDKIAASETNDLDRPVEDVKIISARLIDRSE